MKISFGCEESLLYSLNYTHNKPTQTQKLTQMHMCVDTSTYGVIVYMLASIYLQSYEERT